MRKSIILLVLALSLFHFSPQIASASDNEEKELEIQEESSSPDETEEILEEAEEAEGRSKNELENESNNETGTAEETENLVEDNSNQTIDELTEENEQVEDETETEVKKEAEDANKEVESLSTPVEGEDNVLRFNTYDEAVIDLKINLGTLGFHVSNNPTTYFGSSTEAAVKEFQSYYGVTGDDSGEAGEATLSKVDELLVSPFRDGKSHKNTIKLKELLGNLGYHVSKSPTTYFGSSTKQAIEEFQSDNGLRVNGIADPNTWSMLEELASGPMSKGLYRADVVGLKVNLDKLGFHISNNPTTYYGSSTEKMVKEFQSYYGLTSDGVAGEGTLAKIDEILSSPFRNGKRHEDTVTLKEYLGVLGFPVSKNPTTYYGSSTEQAVKEFQTKYGLRVNGIADQNTWILLRELATEPMYKGLYRADVVDLKINLDKLGFHVSKNPTTYYGSSTEKVVKEFQSYYGVTGDEAGKAGEATLEKIEDLLSSSFRKGKYHEDTIVLKENLARLGFKVSSNPTTYYGSSTEQTVKDFQKEFGLKENGIADPNTWSKLDDLVNGPMFNGLYRDDVVDLKVNLNELGFFVSSNPTTYYGSSTEKVVKEFQSYYGVTGDESGKAGEATLEKIEELLSSPFQYGKSHDETITLKENLSKVGFHVSDNPNSYYGSSTEKVVKEFQSHFDLRVNGIADEPTFNKISEILNSPLQNGKRHEDTIKLKKDLEKLGYEVSSNPTSFYGDTTEEKVREFQADFGLPVSGIADEVTLATIEYVIETTQVEVNRSTTYDVSLADALDLQMQVNPKTDKYRNEPAYIRASDVNVYDGGSITGSSVNLRTSPDLSKSTNIKTSVGNGVAFLILDDNVKGDSYGTPASTRWFKIKYKGDELYVHSSLARKGTKVAINSSRTNIYSEKNKNSHIYGSVDKEKLITVLEEGSSWHRVSYDAWRNATEEDVLKYLDPRKHQNNEVQRFQFLDLSYTESISEEALNDLLSGKGVLHEKGEVFIEAGKENGVNPIYLVSHALLETGNGTSELATGVRYNGKLVFNMYGIGAYDGCAVECGAREASQKGWLDIDTAIIEGAAFIGDGYIQAGQNTLYKMRWDPERMEVGKPNHQYATDIGWAHKQVQNIYDIYKQLNSYKLQFDIPIYK